MAKNIELSTALNAYSTNDKSMIRVIGKKYPLTAYFLNGTLCGNHDAIVALLSAIGGRMNLRRFENALKSGVVDLVDDVDDDDDESVDSALADAEAEDDTPKKRGRKGGEMKPTPWSEMNAYQKQKARKLGAEFVAACKALDEDDEDEQVEEKPKKEKKQPPKKSKKVVEPEDDEDDEDDDDDEPEQKPAKKSKKGEKSKKGSKKAKPVDDEDDDDFDFDFDDDDDE